MALYEVTEHSEKQHERVYSATRSLDAAVAEASDLSERAERLLHLAGNADAPRRWRRRPANWLLQPS